MREIFIDANPLETRIALVEEGRLTELWMERSARTSLLGNVYKGVVKKTLPGLEACFVDIGLGRDGFLPFDDFWEGAVIEDASRAGGRSKDADSEGAGPGRSRPRPGQEIIVQITKEPFGGKGPRLSSWISLAGQYCVLLPGEDQVGISQRIGSPQERQRLREEFKRLLPPGFGLVARTAAESQERRDLQREIKALRQRWEEISRKSRKAKAPAQLYAEPSHLWHVLRDVAAYDIEAIVVQGQELYREIKKNIGRTIPQWRDRLQLHPGPAFARYDLEKQILQAMQRQVWLKSGGRLVIDQTEALTVIDVNSGKYVGRKDAEETVFRVNLEAAAEVARQLRLRDIGGIIVVDFIDMESPQRRERVLEELRRAFAADRSRPEIKGFSALGLVEISRKRTRPSLWHTSSQVCPSCEGTGRIFHPATVAARMMRDLVALGSKIRGARVGLVANPSLADYIEDNLTEYFVLLNRELNFRIQMEEGTEIKMDSFRLVKKDESGDVPLGDFSIDSEAILE